jgi:tRNA-(ms[2]io[6]A)-hydroxylase
MTDVRLALDFLRCRTPAAWVEQAVRNRQTLLLDHASLELKAAQQAQKLIWKYGASARHVGFDDEFRSRLVHGMSRLAREELRHFEQVVALLERRHKTYHAVSPSRYAAALHDSARKDDPGALIDALVIGAIIEARSCERFASLVPALEPVDTEIASFYASLLRSEARHFQDYLELARGVDAAAADARTDALLDRDKELIESTDDEFRFHSGVPTLQPEAGRRARPGRPELSTR